MVKKRNIRCFFQCVGGWNISQIRLQLFLLYSLDLSGIQDFIYTITSDGALKALRARSFYLELLTEHLVDTMSQFRLQQFQKRVQVLIVQTDTP